MPPPGAGLCSALALAHYVSLWRCLWGTVYVSSVGSGDQDSEKLGPCPGWHSQEAPLVRRLGCQRVPGRHESCAQQAGWASAQCLGSAVAGWRMATWLFPPDRWEPRAQTVPVTFWASRQVPTLRRTCARVFREHPGSSGGAAAAGGVAAQVLAQGQHPSCARCQALLTSSHPHGREAIIIALDE